MSLTGDPITDALVPYAQRFVGAVRDFDTRSLDEIMAEVILVTGGRVDPAMSLAVVLAAMVPDDEPPSKLLEWMAQADEYKRLVSRGVSPGIARQLMGQAAA